MIKSLLAATIILPINAVWGSPFTAETSDRVCHKKGPSAVRKRVGGLRQVRSTEEDSDVTK